MALLSRVGTFAKATATPTAEQAVTVGFRPKAVVFFLSGAVALDAFEAGLFGCVGFAADGSEASVAAASDDNIGPSDAARRIGITAAITIVNAAQTLLVEADCAMTASGFALTWTGNNAVAYQIGYLALGGSDIANAKVVDYNPTATGNLAVGTVGFQPDVVLHLNAGGQNVFAATGAGEAVSLGAMTASAQWAVFGLSGDAQATSNTYRIHASDGVLLASSGTGSGANNKLNYVSMDANGFTVNASILSGARRVVSLCLKGGLHKVGSFGKATATPTANQSESAFGFRPAALLLASDAQTANANATDHNRFAIGASDGTNEAAALWTDTDNLATTSVDARHTASKAIVKVDNNTTTVDAEADATLDADGFTLAWTTNDAVATRLHYWAIGASTQAARPDADVSAGGWGAAPLWSKLDEELPDDADHVMSASPPAGDAYEVSLSPLGDPGVSTGHVLRWRAQADLVGPVVTVTPALYQGATLIATLTPRVLGEAFTTYEDTLSGAQADAITDYSALSVRFTADAV
jgi:hypothetical protein